MDKDNNLLNRLNSPIHYLIKIPSYFGNEVKKKSLFIRELCIVFVHYSLIIQTLKCNILLNSVIVEEGKKFTICIGLYFRLLFFKICVSNL